MRDACWFVKQVILQDRPDISLAQATVIDHECALYARVLEDAHSITIPSDATPELPLPTTG